MWKSLISYLQQEKANVCSSDFRAEDFTNIINIRITNIQYNCRLVLFLLHSELVFTSSNLLPVAICIVGRAKRKFPQFCSVWSKTSSIDSIVYFCDPSTGHWNTFQQGVKIQSADGVLVQYSRIQYSAVQCSTVQYSVVQFSTVQCSAVKFSSVQCITS